jgi:uncharacterized protein
VAGELSTRTAAEASGIKKAAIAGFPEFSIEGSMFEDVSFLQYGLVAICALITGTIGGIAGYGTGLLMPLVLVPIVGAEPVVPIIGLSALFTNASRILAFRQDLDIRRALLIGTMALPTCMLGAYGYTFLTGRGAALVIGAFLILMVPTRLT